MMAALNTMGWKWKLDTIEVALGQNEIDFRFADALKTAVNVLTLKYTVKAIAISMVISLHLCRNRFLESMVRVCMCINLYSTIRV
jgi:hypothetical protein